MKNPRHSGNTEEARKLRSRLLRLLQDSKQASAWIEEFFENVSNADVITFKIINKNMFRDKPRLEDGVFDSDDFLNRLRNTGIHEELQFDDPGDFDEWWDGDEDLKEIEDMKSGDWLRDTLEAEHHKNRAKRKKGFQGSTGELPGINKPHPMERLSNDECEQDNVGVFPIGYVEYLEKQNDLLRKNGGKDAKNNKSK